MHMKERDWMKKLTSVWWTYDTVEAVEGRLEVDFGAQPIHLQKHLEHEQGKKYVLSVLYNKQHTLEKLSFFS